jgi:fermentation-respiration switch protein FrsA (DUF1100 family)
MVTGTDADTWAHRAEAGRARLVVLVLALVYVVLAVAGIERAGWREFGPGESVLVFGVLGVSTLLNVVHALIGLVALGAALRHGAVAFALVALVVFTAMSAFGIVARGFGGSGDPLNLTWWNVGLYLLSAAACAFVYALRIRVARHPVSDTR